MEAIEGSRARPLVIDDEDEDVPQHSLSLHTRQVTDIWRRVREGNISYRLACDEEEQALDGRVHGDIAEASFDVDVDDDIEVVDLTHDEAIAPAAAAAKIKRKTLLLQALRTTVWKPTASMGPATESETAWSSKRRLGTGPYSL